MIKNRGSNTSCRPIIECQAGENIDTWHSQDGTEEADKRDREEEADKRDREEEADKRDREEESDKRDGIDEADWWMWIKRQMSS